MKKLFRIAAVAVTGLSFAAPGIASVSAQTASVIDTGPGSSNVVTFTGTNTANLLNSNTVGVTALTPQTAVSGAASATFNTTVGGVGSGTAVNANTGGVGVGITNSNSAALAAAAAANNNAAATATINHTGPLSINSITSTANNTAIVTNLNTVNVSNTTIQTAASGAASASFNTTAGGVTSGAVSNSNNLNTQVVISN